MTQHAAFAKGYQEALEDIARALLTNGQPGVLVWLEDNLADGAVRGDVIALRERQS